MPELRLIAPDPAAYRATMRDLHASGHRRIQLWPRNDLSDELVRFATDLGQEALVAEPGASADASGHGQAPCLLLTETDAVALSAHLIRLADLRDGVVIAPRTSHAFDARPLFLISIPKAGTHLLYSLAKAFGYDAGIVCPAWPKARHWYCLEYSNSHTRATDFFIDTVRRNPFGNRHHPFLTSPALFIYRNPLDILVSEANYYHRDGNAAFGGYLQDGSFEERLLTLIDDPWLFGSFRDRIAGFVPWLKFPNVAALSFEELVGARGGGDDAIQRQLIWSLQLKLHVPGKPDGFATRVFDTESATFNAGQIGSHRRLAGPDAMTRFLQLPQDFMQAFGYVRAGDGAYPRYPAQTEERRRRPLVTSEDRFRDTPILIEAHVYGRSIVRFRGRFYGPRDEDLSRLSDNELAHLPSATEIGPLKEKLAFLGSPLGRLQQKLARWLRA